MATQQEQVEQAQAALRTSRQAYVKQLLGEVFQLRHEPGVQKMLALAKEMRAKALFDLSNGTKDKFEANQATWQAWDYVCDLIEVGPKQVEIPKGDK